MYVDLFACLVACIFVCKYAGSFVSKGTLSKDEEDQLNEELGDLGGTVLVNGRENHFFDATTVLHYYDKVLGPAFRAKRDAIGSQGTLCTSASALWGFQPFSLEHPLKEYTPRLRIDGNHADGWLHTDGELDGKLTAVLTSGRFV